jgi:acyl-CoA reductase-like NAD-dependent aldehyde dehydrogenase
MMENIEDKLKKLIIENRAFIDGEYRAFSSTMKKYSSIDGRYITELYMADESDIESAVAAAKRSFQNRVWADKTPTEKKKILLKLADIMEEHREELALLDTLETGRSLKNYYYDSIPKAIDALRWFAESVDKYLESAIPPQKNRFAVVVKEPIGVVGLITPWNDPLVVDVWKFAPALLMGNSVVLKPAEQASFSILKVAKMALEAGIPPGVFNVVPGYGHIAGRTLALHHDVGGVFFTGSSEVGKLIMQYAGQSNMKKVGLECGGKSPFIVSKNCGNLHEAAVVLAKNIFYNQGQICSAPSRLIIHPDIKEVFLAHLVEESKKYVPSDPLSLESEVGAVVNKEQHGRIASYIELGIQNGARIVTGLEEEIPIKGGCYVSPTILDNVKPDDILAQEEIFGPVLVVLEYRTMQEAIEIANHSKYGLAASVWTDDINEAYQVARLLEAGLVHINSYGEDDMSVPFGGVKESGLGKDRSMYAFEEYSNTKTVWMHLNNL